jgi:hypothetical protein
MISALHVCHVILFLSFHRTSESVESSQREPRYPEDQDHAAAEKIASSALLSLTHKEGWT